MIAISLLEPKNLVCSSEALGFIVLSRFQNPGWCVSLRGAEASLGVNIRALQGRGNA